MDCWIEGIGIQEDNDLIDLTEFTLRMSDFKVSPVYVTPELYSPCPPYIY